MTFENNIELLKDKITDYLTDIQLKVKKISELEIENTKLNKVTVDLKKEVKIKSTSINDLKKEIVNLKTEIGKLKKKLTAD